MQELETTQIYAESTTAMIKESCKRPWDGEGSVSVHGVAY